MDAVPDTTYYAPQPPVEQVARIERQRELNEAQMSLLREVVDDFTEYESWANTIKGLSAESKVEFQAQLMFKQSVAEWCKNTRAKYESRLKSVTEVTNGTAE